MQLAQRIDQLLRSRLGQGISLDRMLAAPLYARDVLLVCDALADTEAPLLARAYRAAAAAQAERQARAAFDWPEDPAQEDEGAASDPFFEFDAEPELHAAEPAPAPRSPWFSPRRWRTGR